VAKALQSLPGVSEVQVDLAGGRATYRSAAPISPDDLVRVIKAAGFEVAE
jgi:copper chaperone CopZ